MTDTIPQRRAVLPDAGFLRNRNTFRTGSARIKMMIMKSIRKTLEKTPLKSDIRDCHTAAERVKFINFVAQDCYPMALYVLIYFIWFTILEHITRLHYAVIYSPLDSLIPFVPAFIVPYYLWFAYVVVVSVLLYFKDRPTFHRFCSFMCIGMTVFLIVSTVWPNIQYLRPAHVAGDDVFVRMCKKIWAADTPTNICPSIHVFNSIAVMCAITKTSWSGFHRKAVYIPMQIFGVLIIASTMFVKQHSVIDVTAALLLSVPCFILCFRNEFSFAGNTGTFEPAAKVSGGRRAQQF